MRRIVEQGWQAYRSTNQISPCGRNDKVRAGMIVGRLKAKAEGIERCFAIGYLPDLSLPFRGKGGVRGGGDGKCQDAM